MKELPAEQNRNLGIDALKLFSMFLIALLHVLGQGGVLAACSFGSARYEAAWLLEVAGYCSVNCFGLATGYVMAGRRVRWRRLAGLWLQVVFWMLAATAVCAVLQPGTVGLSDWLCCLFPVVTKQYWYFTCYFGLFFLMPALNRLLDAFSQASCRRLVLTLVCLFSLLPCLTVFRIFLPALPHPDLFVTNNGYSLLWLATLYLAGGYCKKYGVAALYRRRTLTLWLLAALLFTWLSHWAIGALTARLYGAPMEGEFFVRYPSPTVFLASLCLLLLASRLRVRGPAAALTRTFAPMAFGVYLVHTQPLVWARVMKDAFAPLAGYRAPILFLLAILAALGVFLACLLLDSLRLLFFRLLRIDRLTDRAMVKFQEKTDRDGFSSQNG